MAFDAGFTAAIASELSLLTVGARVEKIFQPTKDSFVFALRTEGELPGQRKSARLLIDAGVANPRIALVSDAPENPKAPPMLCMLMRKHLGGARICSVRQIDFERVIELEFEARDELGFISKKYLYAEIMGKFSNLILCGPDKKILTAIKTFDLSDPSKRPTLVGMEYTLPPAQRDKISPFDESKEGFCSVFTECGEGSAKQMVSRYSGLSPLVARELVYRANGSADALCREFFALLEKIRRAEFVPTLVKGDSGELIEYSFMPIEQYGSGAVSVAVPSFSELIEEFFSHRAREERIRQRASDITHLLSSAEARLHKKIDAQRQELLLCADKEKYKRFGDLITSNIYRLKRGMSSASLVDYYDPDCPEISVSLDSRLTPAANAQRYYKKYNKCKSAEINLVSQISLAERELEYIDTVSHSLSRAESEDELSEIRAELASSGYASRIKLARSPKSTHSRPMEFVTSGGYRVLCGKNNTQNELITHKIAEKNDIWFHIKGYPGSHVIMLTGGEEPPAQDFTEAANIAAVYSKAPIGQKVCVDYTAVKNLKKPPASKPGYVTFGTNYSAYVTPDPTSAERLRKK